jgi:hypothetical protein
MDGNPDVWEGLCGSCNDWVALVSSKKKGTTWFRHAYKVSLIPSSTLFHISDKILIQNCSAIRTKKPKTAPSDVERTRTPQSWLPLLWHDLRLNKNLTQQCLLRL